MKKRRTKEDLISMQGDICSYEEVIFDLAKVGLKKWTKKELKDFLG